jgi:hypothetical protein
MRHVVCPALRPGHGLLVRVPLDASPSLPNPVQIYFCAARFVRLVLRYYVDARGLNAYFGHVHRRTVRGLVGRRLDEALAVLMRQRQQDPSEWADY